MCLEFLLCFDVCDHDPANTGRELKDFMSGLRRLFVGGYVVCVPDGAGSASTPAGPEPWCKTLTQIAVATVREPFTVSYGRHTWTLWGRSFHWSHTKAALRSMQQVARDAIDIFPQKSTRAICTPRIASSTCTRGQCFDVRQGRARGRRRCGPC